MEKASELNIDMAIEKLQSDELGILLIKADEKSMYDVLATKTSWHDRQGMYGENGHISYHLFPLFYINEVKTVKLSSLTESRMIAINNVFKRWTDIGYNKKHSK